MKIVTVCVFNYLTVNNNNINLIILPLRFVREIYQQIEKKKGGQRIKVIKVTSDLRIKFVSFILLCTWYFVRRDNILHCFSYWILMILLFHND